MEKIQEDFMLRAVVLARLGEGHTNPNPLVGAVIVKDGIILGEGYHRQYGGLHAEREAIKNCLEKNNSPKGATIYVTLEPCCHQGKQPPCTQAIVEAGIERVVVGSRDPNPLVHGKGCEFLRGHGIEVIEDFLRDECDTLNAVFFHYIATGTPYVALKFAMTMDGKIATRTGKSQWITNGKSRNFVHVLRNRYSAILAGIGTVLADDPMLNCRLEGDVSGRNPLRIILDSHLKLPIESRCVKTACEIPTVAVCLPGCDEKKKENLEKIGVEVLEVPSSKMASCTENPCDPCEGKPHVDVARLMKLLGDRKIDSVLVEGGGEVNYSFLQSGLVNKIYCFVAPKIFGGTAGVGSLAKSPVCGIGVDLPEKAFCFTLEKTMQFGDDILLEYLKK